jgi:RNA polymerase sigma factor CnrH
VSADLATLDDGELVALSIGGHRRAFGEIMRRHRDPLYRLVRGHLGDADEALDVVQEAFASAHRHLRRFDQTRGLRPWLARIAINRSRDWHRRRRLRVLFGLGMGTPPETIADEAPGPYAEIAARNTLDRAWGAIAALPERLRETLLLRTVEGLGQAETARLLGITEKAVETRLYRARIALKTALEHEG